MSLNTRIINGIIYQIFDFAQFVPIFGIVQQYCLPQLCIFTVALNLWAIRIVSND